jgi:hypothetical protein
MSRATLTRVFSSAGDRAAAVSAKAAADPAVKAMLREGVSRLDADARSRHKVPYAQDLGLVVERDHEVGADLLEEVGVLDAGEQPDPVGLPAVYYITAVKPWDGKAAADPAVKAMLREGVSRLDADGPDLGLVVERDHEVGADLLEEVGVLDAGEQPDPVTARPPPTRP